MISLKHTIVLLALCGLVIVVQSSSNSTCASTHLNVGIGIYLQANSHNITYGYFQFPPTASAGFRTSIRPYDIRSQCNFEVFVGDDNVPCPDENLNNATATDLVNTTGWYRANFSLFYPNTKTYNFGIRMIGDNCDSVEMLFQVSVNCPEWCNGGGAVCSSLDGCTCLNNWYAPETGCNITGECDPFGSAVDHCGTPGGGLGNQTCEYVDKSHTKWGKCYVWLCPADYYPDTIKNECVFNSTLTSTTGNNDHSHFLGPLSKTGFIILVASVGGAVLCAIVFVAMKFFVVKRARYTQL